MLLKEENNVRFQSIVWLMHSRLSRHKNFPYLTILSSKLPPCVENEKSQQPIRESLCLQIKQALQRRRGVRRNPLLSIEYMASKGSKGKGTPAKNLWRIAEQFKKEEKCPP
jgi:hypothetical protein